MCATRFPDMKATIERKPVIALKAIKHSAFASEETHCYQATIYVDGKRFATVRNSGFGGGDEVHPLSGNYDDVRDLEKKIKETYDREPSKYFADGFQPTLESICCDLVNDHLRERDLRRRLKIRSYTVEIADGNRAVFVYKCKPTPPNLQALLMRPCVHHVLNLMPIKDALALVKEITDEEEARA